MLFLYFIVKKEGDAASSIENLLQALEKALRNYLRFVTTMRDVEGWADLYSDLNELTKLGYQSVRQGKEPEVISE